MPSKMKSPKCYCDTIMNGTHQCSNYARKCETKCFAHGPPVVRKVLYPYVYTTLARPIDTRDHIATIYENLKETLMAAWKEYVDMSKYPIEPITEWFEDDKWNGMPYLVVVLPKEDDHDPCFETKIELERERHWFDVDVYNY
jgi:hypothetical protein